ncbi:MULTISPECIES: purine nucleoside phosphorylase YfiH [unclassified Brenneria]|uniref:purine nucleoside phosphorylase YfiH n=1 Tax=unclassified Brenneria TaxID=2634434 RepID=UPI0029C1AFEB|nr:MULTISPECIES: purine nucleoside phosphorylase YfiH [unclassified Brenneria]MDX5629891.1 purine nucleoside phosphorylase YfiH [Brenneria sp. L3-3Z]MDX5697037.1 purine nucleoside phosphorylase YfiH [Brenneria sp. L4-2C]MEE3663851.1 purine nucleoside phosphorylase YfiH [Brenneria sp. g21c3]
MLIHPDWPIPACVRACSTTRYGGVSLPPYDALNLGNHVGDEAEKVRVNRQLLMDEAGLPSMPHWLEQVHGTQTIRIGGDRPSTVCGDAVYTDRKGPVCAVMTADCLPVLFCSVAGDEVAAAHAGWRGLCAGVLEETLSCFRAEPSQVMAWLGPAIGPEKFEVGPEVRDAFIQHDVTAISAFRPNGDKFLADIYQLARLRLRAGGVTQIFGGEFCTVSDARRFFSYRRDGVTGRMASLIWLI